MFPRRLGTPAVCVFLGNSLERDGTALRIGVQFGFGCLSLYIEKEAGFFAKRIRAEGLDSIPVEFSHLAGGS